MMAVQPLVGVRVVDLSSGIAGGYCTKLLADAGADVIKLEPPAGDPLRRHALGAELGEDEDGALFQFLSCGKRSVVVEPGDEARAEQVVASADAVVWSPGTPLAEDPAFNPQALLKVASQAPIVAITPFGLEGPWAGRAATEFTLQAWGGGMWFRGEPEHAPLQVGAAIGDWAAGTFAAVALLLARHRAQQTGVGELVDLSILETIAITHTSMFPITFRSVAGHPRFPQRELMIPGIEPTRDGFVGFMVVTGQNWLDFCVAIGRFDWMDDSSLALLEGRVSRAAELRRGIQEFTLARTTQEVVEHVSLFRVPVAAVTNGASITTFDHFNDQKWYVPNPRGGFLQPAQPYRLPAEALSDPLPPPRLGEHNAEVTRSKPVPRGSRNGEAVPLPLAGLRIADFTLFWAGPIVGSILAAMGAEVIHVESPRRPDSMRFQSARSPDEDQWWEWGPMFMATNTNKKGIAVDLQTDEGRAVALALVRECDVVLENFSPRVMNALGLDDETLTEARPDVILVHMPAFGLNGPWKDRTAYAVSMECVAGMAWVTGRADGEPVVPGGPCDPLAGLHATIATLLALEHRSQTGEGMVVEAPMVGGALNVGAEAVVEYSAYGHVMNRAGNRGPSATPQNLYKTADVDGDGRQDSWVAIAVATDEQWQRLKEALGHPTWSSDSALDTFEGRRARQDDVDAELAEWCSTRPTSEILGLLWPAGVPVAEVVPTHAIDDVDQMQARQYFETGEHPTVGRVVYQAFPARFSGGPSRFHRSPSPTLGRDNDLVLRDLLGMSAEEIDALREKKIIGEAMVSPS
jgi:crotonobetainyl-CoA:carnitine CoA-transferase CaiB-like acyl-CoA transferase